MNADYILTEDAGQDLHSIWEYVAESADEKTADQVVERIRAECTRLSRIPNAGHPRRELLDERHRFWVVWSYLIVYRWETHPVQIVSIVHGACDLKGFFRRRGL